jgi:hypothetical protein
MSLANKKFGRLTVLEERKIATSKRKQMFCKCICECGNLTMVRKYHLTSGHTLSCGCYHREIVSKINKGKHTATLTHGLSKTRLYGVFRDMKTRCYNPNSHDYKNYGGRGIKICDEWLDDYTKFAEWANTHGYDENAKKMDCTIDRIDVNGNYCPENCRWVGIEIQNQNKRKKDDKNKYIAAENGD